MRVLRVTRADRRCACPSLSCPSLSARANLSRPEPTAAVRVLRFPEPTAAVRVLRFLCVSFAFFAFCACPSLSCPSLYQSRPPLCVSFAFSIRAPALRMRLSDTHVSREATKFKPAPCERSFIIASADASVRSSSAASTRTPGSLVSDRLGAPRASALASWSDRRVDASSWVSESRSFARFLFQGPGDPETVAIIAADRQVMISVGRPHEVVRAIIRAAPQDTLSIVRHDATHRIIRRRPLKPPYIWVDEWVMCPFPNITQHVEKAEVVRLQLSHGMSAYPSIQACTIRILTAASWAHPQGASKLSPPDRHIPIPPPSEAGSPFGRGNRRPGDIPSLISRG